MFERFLGWLGGLRRWDGERWFVIILVVVNTAAGSGLCGSCVQECGAVSVNITRKRDLARYKMNKICANQVHMAMSIP